MADVAAEACQAIGAADRQLEAFPTRDVALGHLHVQRALPLRSRRLVGPWCFLDRFGPLSFADGTPMDVAPHPHMGLQTVSWLLDGEVVHQDSLGAESLLRPGAVNVMTAGAAIAHAERTPAVNTGRLNGVQLWTALPDRDRHGAAAFQHVEAVPVDETADGRVQVFSGRLGALSSPAHHVSDLVGADLTVYRQRTLGLPLQADHEHAVLVLDGDCALDGQPIGRGELYYLGTRRTEISVSSATGARLLLVGGLPFPETILMWWNFVARTPEEIQAARDDWEAHRRFGDVSAYAGPRLPAPPLTTLARPNPVS